MCATLEPIQLSDYSFMENPSWMMTSRKGQKSTATFEQRQQQTHNDNKQHFTDL